MTVAVWSTGTLHATMPTMSSSGNSSKGNSSSLRSSTSQAMNGRSLGGLHAAPGGSGAARKAMKGMKDPMNLHFEGFVIKAMKVMKGLGLAMKAMKATESWSCRRYRSSLSSRVARLRQGKHLKDTVP